MGFGKWVYLNSMVYFLSTNFDRLYFAKVVPLQVLGIYGIARALSELFGAAAGQLGNSVIFPFISSHADLPRETLRRELVSIRAKFLLLIALGCSLFIATADLAIKLLYDHRYHAAAWMLPVLTLGAWFSMVATTNESTLLGLGAPSYSAMANSVRCILLVVGLPLSFKFKGLGGGIVTLVLVEVCRYAPVYIGQRRQRFSFGAQDVAITLAMFAMIGLWEWLRWASGFGTSFDSLFE
jgi:O-antigen/teichoic acid export membrane protein